MPQLQPPKSTFPPIPEFYGGEPGPRVTNETAQNPADWSSVYRQSIPPTTPLLDVLMDIANDPRNAWLGLGPMAGAIKGARLIKPLLEAEQSGFNRLLPSKQKSLKFSGSEGAAKILDFNPQLGVTTHPAFPQQSASMFGVAPESGRAATADEIVAAQDILKKLAQQNAPNTVTLYRGGNPVAAANPNTPVPATSDLSRATEFAHFGFKPIFELQVPREDLLANIDKLQRGRGYRESEYLIPLRAFQDAQTRLHFENPRPGTEFHGARIYSPYEQALQIQGSLFKKR